MGGGASKPNPKLAGIIEDKLQKTLDDLGLTYKDVLPFWKEFKKIDVNDSGQIDIDEVFATHEIPVTEWGKKVFQLMDLDGSGQISFPEFFIGLWDYLSADKNTLTKMAFDMVDDDHGGKLSIDEVRQLLVMVHGKGRDKKNEKQMNKKLHTTMKQLDKDGSGQVTFPEWQANSKKIQSLFKPAVELQKKMRKAYFGKNFWMKSSKKRTSIMGVTGIIEKHRKNYNLPVPDPSFRAQLQKKASAREEAKKQGDYDSDSGSEEEEEDEDYDDYED